MGIGPKRLPWSMFRRKADAAVGDLLHDYFPRPLSVLDRDLSLGLVQATLDHGRALGLRPVDARDVLVVDDGGAVTVVPPAMTPTARSLVRVPLALVGAVAGLRHRPLDWVDRDLAPILRSARELRDRPRDGATQEQLLDRARAAIDLRDRVFTSRRPHFLPSFLVKIGYQAVAGWRRGSTAAADLSGYDYPTARFRRDLLALARSRRARPGAGLTDESVRDFLDRNGGRGQTFVPLVSDSVWDVAPAQLLALLPALVAAQPPDQPADRRPGRSPGGSRPRAGALIRRLREIAVARDWVTYGFEQTTRAARDPVLTIGARLARDGVLEQPRDVLHLRLAELREVVRGGPPPAAATIAARRAVFLGRPAPAAPAGPARTLQGVGASPGEFVGVARVVRDAGSGELKPGEILVCEMTSPSWLPLLMIAGAVVTDRGGVLSHAAIVAREFGIPAVTGAGKATTAMVSGSRYRIDGRTGSVVPAA